MQTVRLALIGFGNVGQGFTQILRDWGPTYTQKLGLNFQIVAVSDLLKGCLFHPSGLDPGKLLQVVQESGKLEGIAGTQEGWDAFKTITDSGADAVVEVSHTNLSTGQPAISHVALALQHGLHVVTTNKGPVALKYPELMDIAKQNGVMMGVEGTVMSGTPALRLGADFMKGAEIKRVQGILNGTTNFILTQMESGQSYEDALAEAQARGYAEADPSGDVEGYDAAGKVAILSSVLFGKPLALDQVERTGITSLTKDDIDSARASGERWKLIGSLERDGDKVLASVRPVRVPASHPLASVGGATNAITYSCDLLGEVTLIGPGAGRLETGYALIADLFSIFHSQNEHSYIDL